MPTYLFRCAGCGDLEARFPMASVPPDVSCPDCAGTARKVPTAPRVGRGSSTTMRLLDATARSADQPAVVGALPSRRPTASTRDPRHARLPRPS